MLLDKYGRAFDLLHDVATRENAGDYVSNYLNVLPDPDPILRKLSDEARVLQDLEADEQVTAISMSRKNRVLNRQNYWFKPGCLKGENPGETAKILCDRLVKDLERLNMRDIISGILSAPFYGLAVLEITWECRKSWWHVRNVELKPHYWFAFNRDNKLVFKGENFYQARKLPEGKFILARHFNTYENPYGLRLLSRCFWPVTFKKGGLSFYTRFLEKYGTPWSVTTAPSQSSQNEMDVMAANLSRMVRDACAVIPYGAKLELVSPPSNNGDQHETYLKRMDAAISKVLMGNTLTAEIGERGSYAAAETHKEVADEFAAADMDLVVTGFNDLAWYYTQLNVGPAEMSPCFSYEEAEDLFRSAELDAKLYALGVRFKAEYFKNKYSLADDEFSVSEPPGGDLYNFSAPVNADSEAHSAIESAVTNYLPEAVKADEKIVSQVGKILKEAESFDDFERKLAALFTDLESDDFEELMSNLMINANLMGRFIESEKRRDKNA